MRYKDFPSLLNAISVFAPSPQLIAQNIIAMENMVITATYASSKCRLAKALSGEFSVKQINLQFSPEAKDVQTRMNRAVLMAATEYSSTLKHKLGTEPASSIELIRDEIAINVKPTGYFRANNKVTFVEVNPRLSLQGNHELATFMGSIVLFNKTREGLWYDYSTQGDIAFQLLDMSMKDAEGRRIVTPYLVNSEELLDKEELTDRLQMLAEGYKIARTLSHKPRTNKPRSKDKAPMLRLMGIEEDQDN